MATSPLVVLFFVGWTPILLYGFNAVLFVMGMYLLRQRKAREGTMFLVVSSSVLFILATVSAIVSTVAVVGDYLNMPFLGSPTSINLHACSIIQYIIIHLLEFTAFTILVYRCFYVWGHRYLVIAVPVLIFLGETGVYYYELPQYIRAQWGQLANSTPQEDFVTKTFPFTTASMVLAAVANAMTTSLIAGRMWSLKRGLHDLARDRIQGKLTQSHDSIIAITMESGMIIPTFFIIYTVFNVLTRNGEHHDVVIVMSTMMPQIIALAPLIIMIRVGLGNSALSSMVFKAQTSHGGSPLPHASKIHGDVNMVPVSATPLSESEDLEQNSVLQGYAF